MLYFSDFTQNYVKFSWNAYQKFREIIQFTSEILRYYFLRSCRIYLAIGTIKFRQNLETSRQSHLADIKRNLAEN